MCRTWLIEKRKINGYSQHDIAQKCNISQQAYSFFELGTRRPKYETAVQIADMLDFDWTRFFEDEESETAS